MGKLFIDIGRPLDAVEYLNDYIKYDKNNPQVYVLLANIYQQSGDTCMANYVRDEGYAGIMGLDADFSGRIIGNGFASGLKETTVVGYYASGGKGDKKLVYRTDIINQYPSYPVFDGEKYVALSYKYRLIDQTYKMAVLNEILCYVEYQSDGSSNTMWQQYLNNPRGFAFWRKICMKYPLSYKRLLIDCIHYCSSSCIAHNKKYVLESPRKLLTIFCTPFGWGMTVYIKRKAKQFSKKICEEKYRR